MAATIYIDVDDLPGRLGEFRGVMKPGDRVLVTRGGYPIFHLLPTTREGATLTHIGEALPPPADPPPARRPVGERAGGGVSIGPSFNDPAAWADAITDPRTGP